MEGIVVGILLFGLLVYGLVTGFNDGLERDEYDKNEDQEWSGEVWDRKVKELGKNPNSLMDEKDD